MTIKERNAYFAGFIDGEGYVSAYRTNYTRSNGKAEHTMAVRVIVGQKTPEVLQLGQNIWGGSVYYEIDKRSGNTHYRWEIRGQKATKLIKELLPYIVVKASQCKLVLEYQNLLGKKNNLDQRIEIQERIKSMNAPMGFGKVKKARIAS